MFINLIETCIFLYIQYTFTLINNYVYAVLNILEIRNLYYNFIEMLDV